MIKKLRERLSVFVMKNPATAILLGILFLNLVLFLLSGAVISALAPASLQHRGFWASVFYTISMILDAGCIQFVIADIGEASVALIIVCVLIVLIGMITFTGAVIGYVTNYISNFIESSKSGLRALRISGHTVILNWNSRASEIINDLLYTGERETVAVLVSRDTAAVEREIDERISATLKKNMEDLLKESKDMPTMERWRYLDKHRMKNRVTVIVREGETHSTKQLNDLSISQARTVIILTKNEMDPQCRFSAVELEQEREKGNSNTIKTLVQVAQMTADEDSADGQTIIVEVENDWTATLVNRIIDYKQREKKCKIIPIQVNKVLGQILSQFSIMPELNMVYSELFSNRGAEFFFAPHEKEPDVDAVIHQYMQMHHHAVPLTHLELVSEKTGEKELVNYAYFMANSQADCERVDPPLQSKNFTVSVKPNYQMPSRNVIIIGHNSKIRDIMAGFEAFLGEHGKARADGGKILNITMIDDRKSLEKHNYYSDYPFVSSWVPADIQNSEQIREEIKRVIGDQGIETSVLILSDDTVFTEDIDASALSYLIYIQDVLKELEKKDEHFRRDRVDVIVEILNPKNYDVAYNYSVDNVVISNRYISKMVTQIGRKQELFEFYTDILTYDEEDAEEYVSKELYIKDVKHFFEENKVPGPCNAAELINAVFRSSPPDNRAVVLGCCKPDGEMVMFSGNQTKIRVELSAEDKLIIFSNH